MRKFVSAKPINVCVENKIYYTHILYVKTFEMSWNIKYTNLNLFLVAAGKNLNRISTFSLNIMLQIIMPDRII